MLNHRVFNFCPSLSDSAAIIVSPLCSAILRGGFFSRKKRTQIKESICCGSAVNATFPCLIITTWKIFYPSFIWFSYPVSCYLLLDIFNRHFFVNPVNLRRYKIIDILWNDNYVNIFGKCCSSAYSVSCKMRSNEEYRESKTF